MKAFLKLIRWQNLLIVVLTMVLMRYAILEPILNRTSVLMYSLSASSTTMSLQTSLIDFIILVLATVLITAGGYVINDYFDIKTDIINRGQVIVGTKIPRRQAMMWHNIFNVVGVIAGFYVSFKAGHKWLGILFLVVSGLLYFYSASYKRQFLIGNIIVALLTAMVPMLVFVFEAGSLFQFYGVNAVKLPDLSIPFYWVSGFAIFAFLTTLTREIIKDIEDLEGDVEFGRNTVPVVIGIFASKIVTVCLVFVTLVLLYFVWYFYLNDIITLCYLSLTISLPLIYVIFRIIFSESRIQFHKASRIMKIAMISGILYSVVVKLILTYNLV